MTNSFRNTEPDFSKDEEFRLSPDSEPYIHRIWKARNKGDHKEELLQAQKLLYLHRRGGDDVFTNALSKVARAWESLDRNDIAISYLEEAFNQVRDVPRHQSSKIALIVELKRHYAEQGDRKKIDRLKPERLYKILTPLDWEMLKREGRFIQPDGGVNFTTLFKVSDAAKPYMGAEPTLIVCQIASLNFAADLIHSVSDETGEILRIESPLTLDKITICSELELDREGLQYALRRTKSGDPVVVYGTP